MIYRIANQKDLNDIITMKNIVKERIQQEKLAIWENDYPLDSLLAEDVEQGFGRIIEDQNRIIAYASFHPASVEYPPKTFKKEHLYSFSRVMVHNDYVGKHCGSYLIQNLIEEARNLSLQGLGILVDACNTKAVRLYEKYGFRKEGSKQFPFAYLDIYGLYFKK